MLASDGSHFVLSHGKGKSFPQNTQEISMNIFKKKKIIDRRFHPPPNRGFEAEKIHQITGKKGERIKG
jgi:hypothetical protein